MRASADAQRYLLETADQLQGDGKHRDARLLLQSELLTPPEDELKAQYLLLAMAGAVALEDGAWAEQLAQALRPNQFLEYREDLQPRAATLQFETFILAQKPLPAALTLIEAPAGLILDNDNRNDRIWQLLKQTSESAIEDQSRKAIGFDVQGWTELALILREPDMTLEAQGRAIRSWQANWPEHPAARALPSELALITTLSRERPMKIALALPVTGPLASAGAAIRNGFLAAFYADQTAPKEDMEITVTDTHEKIFGNLYAEMQKDKPDLIVGPLEKDALASVTDKTAMPVPLLALNYYDGPKSLPDQLYQFGLSPEDEARQIAERLQQEDRQQVLVMIPEGDWGNRVENALLQALDANEIDALRIERFFRSDNLREVTANLLGINASRQRAIDVERTAGTNIEFEPRRRQDVDAIVLVAQPNVARQLKPLFGFYFAGALPVYSPSTVYEGRPDPGRDQDLNGVRFTDMPWTLEDTNEFREVSREAFPDMGGQLGRLFAMGADAYNLSSRLALLQRVSGSSVDGLTGTLTMSRDGRIKREQVWAAFKKGEPVLLPDPVTDEEAREPPVESAAPSI
ncbi:MAG: penicillin-binding protein activator [Oleiphilaceae bacterium]|nr:penicillin-binding protein activator [Oleiphilaceae bacterium]